MSVHVIDTIKPKNGLSFPIVEDVDVLIVDSGKRLSEVVATMATQAMIEALQLAIAGKASQSDLEALQATVAGKADVADLIALEAEVDTKADSSALTTAAANLQSQINQIVISSSAEAVVAPEVAAARVDDNGIAYTTLKERLDSDASSINQDILNSVTSTANLSVNISDYTDYVNGSLDGGGAETDSTTRIRSNYIYVAGNKKISLTINSGYQFQLCTFTASKSKIVKTDTWVWRSAISLDCDGTFAYIRIIIKKTNDESILPAEATNISGTLTSNLSNTISSLNDKSSLNNSNINSVAYNVRALSSDLSHITKIVQGSVSGTGEFVDSVTRIRTDYIDILGMQSISITANQGYQIVLCTYNENKEKVTVPDSYVTRNSISKKVTDDFRYIVIVVKKANDAEISVSEISNITVDLNSNLSNTVISTRDDVTTVTECKNIFNVDTIKENVRLNASGEEYSDNGYFTSDYIEVELNSTYTKNSPIEDAYHRVCFYDTDKVFIADSTTSDNTFSTSTAKYIRFCGELSEVSSTRLCKGSKSGEFTAIDNVARDNFAVVSRKEIELPISWEIGTFYSGLQDAPSTTRLRTPKLSNLKDTYISLQINPGFKMIVGGVFGDNVTLRGRKVIHPNNIIRIAIAYDDDRAIQLTDAEAAGLKIHCYHKTLKNNQYDVVVASSTSSDFDKSIADFVCDGVDDAEEIEYAANYMLYKSHHCNVLLLPGTYNIDSFSKRKLDNDQTTIAQYGIMLGDSNSSTLIKNWHYGVSISGRYRGEHRLDDSSTIIKVTDSALLTLSENDDNSLICQPRYGDNKMGLQFDEFIMSISNVMIYTNGAENNIIAIDGAGSGELNVENCDIWSVLTTGDVKFDTTELPDGSIGIRGNHGSCRGVKQQLKSNRIVGYKEGIALLGEHFIVQDNLQHHCYYGFTIGNYDVRLAMEHPNIFIGNSVEQCYRMGLLNLYGATEESETYPHQTFIYIGGSTETTWRNSQSEPVPMLPIKEVVKGAYRGRIESDRLSGEYSNSLFEEGSGTNMIQTVW